MTNMVLSTRAKTFWAVISAVPIMAFFVWDGPSWSTLGLTFLTPVLLALPHEGLHRVGHRLCGVRARLGILRGAFGLPTLAVQALEPQTVRSYRLALTLPALVLGFLPTVLGVWLGSPPLLLIGSVGVSMASSDLAVWFHIRPWPDRKLVRDHPTEVGVLRVD